MILGWMGQYLWFPQLLVWGKRHLKSEFHLIVWRWFMMHLGEYMKCAHVPKFCLRGFILFGCSYDTHAMVELIRRY